MKFCNLLKFEEPLPAEFQNLAGGGRWGGGMWLADFCPTVVSLTSEHCTVLLSTDPQ